MVAMRLQICLAGVLVLVVAHLAVGAEYDVSTGAFINSGGSNTAVAMEAPQQQQLSAGLSMQQPVNAQQLCGGEPCTATPYSIVGRLVRPGQVGLKNGQISISKYDNVLHRLKDRASQSKSRLAHIARQLSTLRLEDKQRARSLREKISTLRARNIRLLDQIRDPHLKRGPPGDRGARGKPGHRGHPGVNGRPGEKGRHGPRGERGPRGLPGVNGRPGKPGRPGRPGHRGHVGRVGLPGLPGAAGNPGPRGYEGNVGRRGHRGNRGLEGLRGRRGAEGLPGPRGPRGPAGKQGRRGRFGIQGPLGARGWRGRSGLAGPRGIRGVTGVPGKRGPIGAPGPWGPRGRHGPRGEPGRPGEIGAKGTPGPWGRRGPQGPTGKPGIAGPDGKNGKNGRNGEAGRNGRPGMPGAPGARGPPGRPGENGAPGTWGRMGVRGPRGPPGLEGYAGRVGARGPPGERGLPGPNGRDGHLVSAVPLKGGLPRPAMERLEEERRLLATLNAKLRVMKRNHQHISKKQKRLAEDMEKMLDRQWSDVREEMHMSDTAMNRIRDRLREEAKEKAAAKLHIRQRHCPKCRSLAVRPLKVKHVAGKSTLVGSVINYANNNHVPHAEVIVKKDGKEVARTTANGNGRFALVLKPGKYKISAEREHFVGAPHSIHLKHGTHHNRALLGLSPRLTGKHQVRFVLLWSQEGRDLDAQLRLPGDKCKVSYYHRICHNYGLARVDVDSAQGSGPETITIVEPKKGTYKYSVHEYAKKNHLAKSHAKVLVFTAGKVHVFHAAKAAKGHRSDGEIKGKVWKVLKWKVDEEGEGHIERY